jgi:hypothetical protein
MKALLVFLWLFSSNALSEVYWDDDFETGLKCIDSTDYTGAAGWQAGYCNNNLSSPSKDQINWTKERSYTGAAGLKLIYPDDNSGGGPFIHRFHGKNKQYNLRFAMYLVPGFKTASSNNENKLIYLRSDTTSTGYPNGVLNLFGSVNDDGTANLNAPFYFGFALQGAVDRNDSENIFFNISIQTGRWYEIQFQWIMNDVGQKNGSMSAWVIDSAGNWSKIFFETGRQYGSELDDMIDGTMLYRQGGDGTIYFDRIAVGNSFIASAGQAPAPTASKPAAPKNLRVM